MDAAGDVRLAAAGDQAAWDRLVDRYVGLAWSVARAHRLSDADAADVVQTAWLRLVENLASLREPERVGAWLVTTTKREALRVIRTRQREVALDEGYDVVDERTPAPEQRLVAEERSQALWAALGRLGGGCQKLLRVLMATPPPRYEEISAALDMPIGSIGPTRARCLAALRKQLGAAGITAGSDGSG